MAKKPSKRTGSNGVSEKAAPVRPYFLSLTLENVRCFGAKQTLKLHDDQMRPARWTIVLGNNGTGKTTLLQALVALMDDWNALAQGKPLDYIGPSAQLLEMARGTVSLELTAQLGLGLLSRSEQWEQIDSRHRITWDADRAIPELERPQFSSLPVIPWVYSGYGAGRRLATSRLGNSDPLHPAGTLLSDQAFLENPEEWLLQLDYSSRVPSPIQTRQQQRLEQVRQLLLHILPEVEDVRLSTPSEQYPTPRVEFLTPYGWVHLRSLGYGYQTLIAWMVDLSSRLVERYPDSPDPLAEPAVVLVDEIDLHLHPQWQRTLIGHLTARFPNAQFIVTAHSPLVVQSAADANLVLLRREGDHVVIDNDVQSVHGWRIDQIYTSELFGLETARPIGVEELLLKRRKLLEKSNLSEEDWKEVANLEEQIGDLPAGESAAHLESIRRAEQTLDLIKKHLEANP